MSKRVLKNLSWSAGGVVLSKAFTPILSILIARLITPEQFGNFSLALTIIFAFEFIKDFGFNEAIISSDNDNVNEKICHQFTIQLYIGIFYIILLIPFSFFIDQIFNAVNLGTMLRILAFVLILRAFTEAVLTKYIKEANFRPLFFRTIIPSAVYGIVSLILLHQGFDETSLAIGFLLGELFLFVFLIRREKYFLRLVKHFKYPSFFNYGKHIVLQKISTGLLLSKLDGIILSFFYSSNTFGMYRMSRNLSNVLPSTVLKEVSNVIFSEVSYNKDAESIIRIYKTYGVKGSFLLLLVSATIIPLIPFIIPTVLGLQWVEAVVIIQIFVLVIPSFQIRNTQQVILKSKNELSGLSTILLSYSVIFLVTLLIESFLQTDFLNIAKSIVVLDCIYSLAHARLFHNKITDHVRYEYLFYLLFICQLITYLIIL
ncbi:oligosaccharide flippase family protein [Reichenbachiella sp.]